MDQEACWDVLSKLRQPMKSTSHHLQMVSSFPLVNWTKFKNYKFLFLGKVAAQSNADLYSSDEELLFNTKQVKQSKYRTKNKYALHSHKNRSLGINQWLLFIKWFWFGYLLSINIFQSPAQRAILMRLLLKPSKGKLSMVIKLYLSSFLQYWKQW